MESHREEQPKKPETRGEPKPRRFRLVKLEERIAPAKGYANGTHKNCAPTDTCWCTCTCTICGGGTGLSIE